MTDSPTYRLTNLPTYLLTYLPTHQLTYLPTHLLTCLATHLLTYSPTAGQASRAKNDKEDMFLSADVDTEFEQAAYAKVMGGAAMTELLAGDGYYQVRVIGLG